MEIVGNFKNGTITISNLKTEDSDYNCHFSFDINVKTFNTSYTYNFGEAVYFSMYSFIDGKQPKLQDENSIGNYIELTKEYFSITVNQEGFMSNLKIDFDNFEDQEELSNFLIELNAYCETLIRR